MKIIRPPLFMRPTPESELEQSIDRELHRLPGRRAPATLMPRVLMAIAERQRLPWWKKSYAHWPWTARLLFLVTSSALGGLLIYFTWGLSIGATWGTLMSETAELTARFQWVADLGGALCTAAVLVVKSLGSWVLWVGAGVLAVCYLTTFALGTVWYRLASQRI